MINSQHNSEKHQQAYTLIEILIAAALFAVIIGSVLFSFSNNSQTRNKIKTIRETSINARYAIEAIARELRLAASFKIVSGNDIIINSYDENGGLTTREYIVKEYSPANNNNAIFVCLNNTANCQPLTNPSINISSINGQPIFNDQGSNSLISNIQPFVEINLSVNSKIGKKITDQFTQSLSTRVATRIYPGFNQFILVEKQS